MRIDKIKAEARYLLIDDYQTPSIEILGWFNNLSAVEKRAQEWVLQTDGECSMTLFDYVTRTRKDVYGYFDDDGNPVVHLEAIGKKF